MRSALGAVALLAAIGAVSTPQPASAAICAVGTMASYQALGATGCSVGNLTFANFHYASTAGGTAVAVSAKNVAIVPIPKSGDNGLLFSTGGWTAFGGGFVDSTIFFTVAAGIPIIDDATLLVAGGDVGIGSGTVGESLLPVNKSMFASVDGPVSKHVVFGKISQISVLKDILVAAAANNPGPNFATITAVLQEFSTAVPELGTWAMMIIGFAGVGLQLRRRARTVSLTA